MKTTVVDPGRRITRDPGGESLVLLAELEAEVMSDPVSQPAILNRLETAGREQDGPVRIEQGFGVSDDALLKPFDRLQGVVVESISSLGSPGEHPGVAAGNVEDEQIGPTDGFSEVRRIDDPNRRVIDERSSKVVPAALIDVGGEDLGFGMDFRQLASLGPSSGAVVDDDLGTEPGGGRHGLCAGGVLHPAGRIRLDEAAEIRRIGVEDEEAGAVVGRQRPVFTGERFEGSGVRGGDAHWRLHQVVEAKLSCDRKSVGADPVHHQRLAVAGLLAESENFIFGEDWLLEEHHAPVRVEKRIPAQGGFGDIRMSGGQHGTAKSGDLAEYRVDQSRGTLMYVTSNPIHRLVDGGVIGHRVHEQQFRGTGQQGRSDRSLKNPPVAVDLGIRDGLKRVPAMQDHMLEGLREGRIAG